HRARSISYSRARAEATGLTLLLGRNQPPAEINLDSSSASGLLTTVKEVTLIDNSNNNALI
ncbi:MAG: hypothetical protein ACYC55_00595, partial [Candidatus Geothermincolia bacterium]